MKIHESYGKKDLVKIINENNIDIDIKLSKKKLIDELDKLNEIPEILFKENINKNISIKEKNDIILKSKMINKFSGASNSGKMIISFCNNGCDYNRSFFNNKEQVIETLESISKYGDISSVRRATRLINEIFGLSLECEISEDIKLFLDTKKQIKKLSTPSLQVKLGAFKVYF